MHKTQDAGPIQFLFVELQTGMTFADIALSAQPSETDKIRTDTANARKAHDSFLHFRDRVTPSEEENRAMDAGLEKLKTALRLLGGAV